METTQLVHGQKLVFAWRMAPRTWLRPTEVVETPVTAVAGGAPRVDDVSGVGGLGEHLEFASLGVADRFVGRSGDDLPVVPAEAVVEPLLEDRLEVLADGEDLELGAVDAGVGSSGDDAAVVAEVPVAAVAGRAPRRDEVPGPGVPGEPTAHRPRAPPGSPRRARPRGPAAPTCRPPARRAPPAPGSRPPGQHRSAGRERHIRGPGPSALPRILAGENL